MSTEVEQSLYDEAAERGVLSALMLNANILDDSPLMAECFYLLRHQQVFKAIQSLREKNDPIDLISVGGKLEQMGFLTEVGGRGWIAELSCEMPSTQSVTYHAELVRECAKLRDLQRLAKHILMKINSRTSSEDIIREMDKTIQEAYRSLSGAAWQTVESCVAQTLEQVDKAYRGEGGVGLPTGLVLLDWKIDGLKSGNLNVIAGRTSMGKTSLALVCALAATEVGGSVGIFSLEMSNVELVKRLLTIMGSGISISALDRGNISPNGWQSLCTVSEKLSTHKIFICDEPTVSIEQVRMKARNLKRQHGLDLLVIDYLQLLATDRRTESRVAAMSEISRSLKVLAKELEIPIIALSQLNRSCESRPDKRPLLSDLRESGAIEQDADMVIFIYRDEVYDEESPDKGTAELLIRKNRNGPIGEIRVAWHAKRTAFGDLQPPSLMKS